MKVLVAGISGKIGRLVARRLMAEGHKVVGLDRRPWPDAPRGLKVVPVDIRKRPAEDVFRKERPDAVVHMATVTHFSRGREERSRINLDGTRRLFDYCSRYEVAHTVFVGRHTYYGAAPDTPLYHQETEPPLAVTTFPELADLVAADLYAGTALWRFPELKTTVLRICYTLGPTRHGTLATFVKGPLVPCIPGFDPLFQFMHESDAVNAICLTLDQKISGVYNVAGPQPVPLSLLIKVTGRRPLHLPEVLMSRALGHFGLPRLPSGALGHLKYPVVADASAFRAATGFEHEFDEVQTMESFRWA